MIPLIKKKGKRKSLIFKVDYEKPIIWLIGISCSIWRGWVLMRSGFIGLRDVWHQVPFDVAEILMNFSLKKF